MEKKIILKIRHPKKLLKEIEEVLNFISEQKKLKEAPSITKSDILYEVTPNLKNLINQLKRKIKVM